MNMQISAHSEKGLKTISEMHTKPEDWGLVEIKWVKETRNMPCKENCPSCFGSGRAYFEADGSLAVNKISTKGDYDYTAWSNRQQEIHRLTRGQCPTCPPRWGGYGSGQVKVFKPMKVWIGYPQWEAGTKFDSRFGGFDQCGLCNKVIKASGFVPVHGKDNNGIIHGMWVGEDCARKFFDIKKWKKDSTAFVAERKVAS